MVIYGGIDLDNNILDDVCLLDLVHLKWYKYDFNVKIPQLAYHCSTIVIKSENFNLENFSIFKIEVNPTKKSGKIQVSYI